jgi:hypothetical protein
MITRRILTRAKMIDTVPEKDELFLVSSSVCFKIYRIPSDIELSPFSII